MSSTERRKPKVNEVNEFLEIASDFEDPLEVIRESLSNSFDAGADEVNIKIKDRTRGSDIIIEDDGHGMDHHDLEAFFDLGNSRKTDSIGYKGHGTKIFYKSDEIVVNTTNDGNTLRAVMDEPWRKLNDRILPEYEVTETEYKRELSGTYIRISGFRSGQGFDPSSLSYQRIHNYLKWKTIAGSTAHFFDGEYPEMTITVELDDAIDDSQDRLVTTNRFEFPEEQLEPGDGEFPADRMCKHYPPREIELEAEDGQSTVEIVGMVGGKAARNELPTFGRHSTQFGVWLAKDHIKVEQMNDAISHDNEFIHFLFVANCQDIELSANREKVRNKSSSVFQALEREVKHYLSKISSDPWFKQYLEERRIGELNRRAESQQSTVRDRRNNIYERSGFEPANQPEVVIGLERSNNGPDADNWHVEDFDPSTDVNAIIRSNGSLKSSSVHVNLVDHFEGDKPLESVEAIVCWDYGDRDELRQIERAGYHNGEVSIDTDDDEIVYQKGGEHQINIINVKTRLNHSGS